jgi:DNA-directed RNA polymerase specialized sigma24 family protein
MMDGEIPGFAEASANGGDQVCGTTLWTVVLAAGAGGTEALEQLCRIYWPPVHAFIRKRRGDNDAQDLTQAFFAQILSKQWIKDADRQRGKFRNFLLTSVDNFLRNEWHRSMTEKRGGRLDFISIHVAGVGDVWPEEPFEESNPAREYDRKWAAILVHRARERLRNEFIESGHQTLVHSLYPFLVERGENLELVAAKLKMTVNAVRVAIHRLRLRYGELLRAEVAQTVPSPDQVDEELRYLMASLA